MRSAWSSLKECCAEEKHLGAQPGAVMVLHTFGSDLKYHLHVHCLVPFGGIDKEGKWVWPKDKTKIVKFRDIRAKFREIFLAQLAEVYENFGEKIPHADMVKGLDKKEWCVHQKPPSGSARVITIYLSKYINRIGLSINRFEYDQVHKKVLLLHKDYQNSKDKEGPPPMATKEMTPLEAIDAIMQHCLPAYFQKTRYYGIHSSATYRKHQKTLKKRIKTNGKTVKTIIQLISISLGYDVTVCQKCGHKEIVVEPIKCDSQWIHSFIKVPTRNKDPSDLSKYSPQSVNHSYDNDNAMLKTMKNGEKSIKKGSKVLF